MPVYFIEACESGRVKIGYTSGSPRRRLSQLRVGAAERLRIIAVMNGDEELEQKLHCQFQAAHCMGEWYDLTPSLNALCAEYWAPDDPEPKKRVRRIGELALPQFPIISKLGGVDFVLTHLQQQGQRWTSRKALEMCQRRGRLPGEVMLRLMRMAKEQGVPYKVTDFELPVTTDVQAA